MKRLFAAVFTTALLWGCAYQVRTFPMQRGESAIFNSEARANQYRAFSGNDLMHTGRVVQITRPCSLTTE